LGVDSLLDLVGGLCGQQLPFQFTYPCIKLPKLPGFLSRLATDFLRAPAFGFELDSQAIPIGLSGRQPLHIAGQLRLDLLGLDEVAPGSTKFSGQPRHLLVC
jgi:hypothetical protein